MTVRLSPESDPILDYLGFVAKHAQNRMNWRYGSYEQLLLENGRSFTLNETPEHLEVGKLGQCFSNALHVALVNPEYNYCEGYAIHGKLPIPIQHAWLTDGDNAIDVTWGYQDGLYFGIEFDNEWAMQFMVDTGYYGVLGNDWKHNHSLLKNGLPRKPRKEGT